MANQGRADSSRHTRRLALTKEPLFLVPHMASIVLREFPHHVWRACVRALRLIAHPAYGLGERHGKLVKSTVVRAQVTQARA
jgi:hypothetical protein